MTSHAQTLISCLATNLAGIRVLAYLQPDEARQIAARLRAWLDRFDPWLLTASTSAPAHAGATIGASESPSDTQPQIEGERE